MSHDFSKRRAATPSLLDAAIDLDKDILRLLARRAGMLQRLRGSNERLDAATEKTLRAAWERGASRMSRDVRLARQVFSLLQEVEFLPRPAEGEERRPAFNLAPSRGPVDVHMSAPLAGRRARLYLALAAVSGCACRLAPTLLGDPEVECVKMFNQCGTSLAWDEDGTLRAREGGGLTLADKVVFVGDNALNFYLLLGQYAGRPSRAKFTGESSLKLADFSALRRFLPQMGVRLTNAVPKSDGLPVRIECSGVLPELARIPADLPPDAVTGLLMGAPFWERPVAFDLSAHPAAENITREALDILKECAADARAVDGLIRITPGSVRVPPVPSLGMDLNLAAPLLALPAAAAGRVRLDGRWPRCGIADALETLLRQAGVEIRIDDDGIEAARASDATANAALDAASLPQRFGPLALALAALPALRGGEARLPALPGDLAHAEAESFLSHLGLEIDAHGALRALPRKPAEDDPWTAPSPAWAMALALTAFARPGLKLANPGVMTDLYPAFWNLYNALPCPERKKIPREPASEKPVRRRIIAADAADEDRSQ